MKSCTIFLPVGGTFTTTSGLYTGNNSLTNSTGFNSTQQVASAFLPYRLIALIWIQFAAITSYLMFELEAQILEIFMKHAFSICYISPMTHSNINHSQCQKLCTQAYLLYLLQHVYYAIEGGGGAQKQDRSLSRCRTEQTCVCIYFLESAL